MTTYKTTELSGHLLDAAVAECGEWKTAYEHFPTMTLDPTFSGWFIVDRLNGDSVCMLRPNNPFRQDPQSYMPSTDWHIGGAIIDRERIGLIPQEDGKTWLAKVTASDWIVGGTTALEAAMRAYVVAKLGEEVELP